MIITPNILIDYYQNCRLFISGSSSCNILYRSTEKEGIFQRKPHYSSGSYVKRYNPESAMPLKSSVLYIVTEHNIPGFISKSKQYDGELQYIFLVTDSFSPEDFVNHNRGDHYIILSTNRPFYEILDELSETAQMLFGWDSYFTQGILHDHHTEELLASIEPLLPWDYVFADMDGNIIYATEGYRISRALENASRISSEMTQDLFSRKKFHELIREQDCFYFYTDFTDSTSLCQNLFINGRYIARLVMPLPAGAKKAPPGIEVLFRICTGKLKDLLTNRNLLPVKHNNDRVHQLCKIMLEGNQANTDNIAEILEAYKWSIHDTYSLASICSESAPGWNTNLHMIYSFLVLELEKKWYNACAVYLDDRIFLLYNHSRDSINTEKDDYLQTITYFLRDNLCKAGFSPRFQDFAKLSQAKKAAGIALQMGMQIHPHMWYYQFQDYRLTYMLNAIDLSAAEDLLINPKLKLLKDYDAAHDGELSLSLKTFLESNMNMTNAAKKLFIHRTSFCRRMNHIETLTGLDFENPDEVLDLLLSFRILEKKPESDVKL